MPVAECERVEVGEGHPSNDGKAVNRMIRSPRTSLWAFLIVLLTMIVAALPTASAAGVGGRGRSDTVPPGVSISAPGPGAAVSGTIAVAGAASDDVGLLKVKYRVDTKGNYVLASGTTSWTGSVDTTRYSDGAHVLSVRVVDSSGNGTTATVTFVIANGAAPPPPSPGPIPDPSPSPAPSPSPGTGRTVWGIYSAARDSLGGQDVTRYIESLVGRSFGGQRIYSNMSYSLPEKDDLHVASEGGVIYHNINSFYLDASGNKVCRPWADVAAGVYDPWWIGQAQNIKAFAYPVLLSFNHEPTVDAPNHPLCGTPDEFRAAYDHLVQLFADQGVTNVTWVWTLTAATFNGQKGGPTAWEPSRYDIVGVDGYNRASKWRTPQEVFQAAEDFSRLRGKPLLVGELGVEELPGNPSAKADWIRAVAEMFKSFGNVTAIMWSNDTPYWVDSSPQALEAFIAAGQDPYYGG